MTKTCLKCGCTRKETDTAPDSECPQCGAVYAKVEAALIKSAREKNAKAEKQPELSTEDIQQGAENRDYLGIFYKAIAWFFGGALFFMGLMLLTSSVLAGLSYLSVAGLLLPPAREFVYKKTNIKLKTSIRVALILVLLIIRPDIYRHNSAVTTAQVEPAPVEIIPKIERQPEPAPVVRPRRNKTIKSYQPKVAWRAPDPAEDRKKQIESQFSQWNGAHIKVERYIKERMKNPDSYQHAETRYFDRGNYLLISTKYRGTNSFNAVVLQANIFKVSSENGEILEILQ